MALIVADTQRAAGGNVIARTQAVSSGPTVSGVTVSPATATGSTTFTAVVNGTGSPSQAVTWSATAGSISAGGVFTAPAQTASVQTITVTATSAQDGTKSGMATVTIAANAPTPPGPAYVGGGAAPPDEKKRKLLKKILPPSDKPSRSEIVSELDGIAEMFNQGYEGRLIDPQPQAAPKAVKARPMYSPIVMQMRAKYMEKA